MGLVEIRDEKPKLFLRIYGRGYFNESKRRLILFWRKLDDSCKDAQVYLQAKESSGGKVIDLTSFTLGDKDASEYRDSGASVPEIICVIDEEANKLDERKAYWVTVGYRGTGISQSVEVLPRGIYPDHDKDDMSKNVHNYLWDGESKPKTWRKWSAVKTATGYAAAVVIMPCPGCGYDGSNREKL